MEMLKHCGLTRRSERNVVPEELGATGVFLASDGATPWGRVPAWNGCQIMGM